MADAKTGNYSATDIQKMMAQLAEMQANASDEAKEILNQGIVNLNSNLSQDERNKARAKEKTEKLAAKNAKASKVHLALSAWMREIDDDISITVRFERYKDATTGTWVWKLQGLSGENGEKWLPEGKQLKFTYDAPNGTVHYLNYYETDAKHPRGTKRACDALLHGLDIWKEPNGKPGSTASTKLRTELDKMDKDGNPAGGSDFRHALEKVWITHPDINGGKPQKLIQYYLGFLADGNEEEEQEEETTTE